jgi:hypothetical protein
VAVALTAACNLVADLDGYEVFPNGESGGGGVAGTGGSSTAGGSAGAGAEGGDGGQGGMPDLPCGSECTGDHLWTTQISGIGDEQLKALAVDPTTNSVYVGGEYFNTLDVGLDAYSSPDNDRDIFVAKLDDTGNVAWSIATQSTDHQHLAGLVLLEDGSLIGVGYFEQTMSFGGQNLSASTLMDLLTFRLLDDGSVDWAANFGGSGHVRGFGVTSHPGGGFIAVGEFGGTLDLGGGALSTFGGVEAYMAHFDAAGAHVWSQSFGSDGNDDIRAVERTPDDGFVVLGTASGPLSLGGPMLPHAGDLDIFVAKYDQFAVHQWSKSFGGAEADSASGLAVDEEGRIFIAGEFRDVVSFGGEMLTSMGDADAFVAVLDESGEHVFSARFGDAAYQSARAASDDTFGNVLFGGTYAGAIDFGEGLLESGGDDEDIFITKIGFEDEGLPTLRYSKSFGNPGDQNQRVDRIRRDGEGNGIIAGTFDGTVNFGGGPRNAVSGDDVFVVKLTK